MKMFLLIAAVTTFSIISSAQDTVVVIEKSLKIAGMSPVTEYYGFAEGDKLIFSLYLDKGELKDITISEYPGNVKFSDHSIEKIDKKIIPIARNGIYQFEYYNSFVLPRTLNIKVQRIPKNAKSKSFNTNVRWIDKTDTVYQTQQDTYTLGADTSYEEVINTKVKINSSAIRDNSNKTALEFLLPAGTLKWVYWIGTGNESEKIFENDGKKFAESGIKLRGTVNPLAGFAGGLSTMTRSSEANNIHYYFISSYEEMQKFTKENSFKYFKQGDGPVDFSLMNYANKNPQKYYLGLRNNNATQSV
ncbi:MAG: hypothetical protein JJE22_18460, partial [Bacteroidia bacterium]|nr:hypothetical protein [Bacteroidia bacterium]